MIGGGGRGENNCLPTRCLNPLDVAPEVFPPRRQVMMLLPQLADDLIDYRFPDALDIEVVKHSDEAFTVTLMDLDYQHYTFRLSLSLDYRWTLVPIAGFDYGEDRKLDEGWLTWARSETPDKTPQQ